MKSLRLANAQDHVTDLAIKNTNLKQTPDEAVAVVVRGMILAKTFPVVILNAGMTINQDVKALLTSSEITSEYLSLYLRGREREMLALVERSTHGTCRLDTDTLLRFKILLPPLAEQARIVAKVEELAALCDRLRDRLAAREETAKTLAEALVTQAAA